MEVGPSGWPEWFVWVRHRGPALRAQNASLIEGSSAHDAPERKRKRYPDASVDREEGAADDPGYHSRVVSSACPPA